MDRAATIREVLVQTSKALYAQCGARVYYATAPDDFNNAQKAVVFQFIDGLTEWENTEEVQSTVRFVCYGGDGTNKTYINSEIVAAALFQTIHGYSNANQSVASGCLVSAQELSRVPLQDPDVYWCFTQSIYTVVMRPLS